MSADPRLSEFRELLFLCQRKDFGKTVAEIATHLGSRGLFFKRLSTAYGDGTLTQICSRLGLDIFRANSCKGVIKIITAEAKNNGFSEQQQLAANFLDVDVGESISSRKKPSAEEISQYWRSSGFTPLQLFEAFARHIKAKGEGKASMVDFYANVVLPHLQKNNPDFLFKNNALLGGRNLGVTISKLREGEYPTTESRSNILKATIWALGYDDPQDLVDSASNLSPTDTIHEGGRMGRKHPRRSRTAQDKRR